METSDKLEALFGALAKAQAKMGSARKGSANPFFKSKYADLSEVRKTAQVIHEFGLAITQFPDGENGLVTVLGHESGQYIKCHMQMKPVKNDPQGLGSCLTYMRRYAMQSVLGIPSEDDDGNKASKKTAPKRPDSKYSTDEKREMFGLLQKLNTKEAQKFKNMKGKWTDSTWDQVAVLLSNGGMS